VTSPDTRPASEQSLIRALGVWGLAASIVNITIGGGIFRLPAAAAGLLGPAAPLVFIVCAIAMALIVLCFAEAGSRVAMTGGIYAYIEVAFGPLVGFIAGVLLWAGSTVATAAVASFFGDSLVALIPALAPLRTVTIVTILAALTVLNIAGVRGASRFNGVMTVAKLLPLVLFIIVGVAGVKTENLHWSTMPGVSDLSRGSVVLIFAFLGIESALMPSAEVRDPSRTVPRAIFIAMAAIAIIYLIIQVIAQGILGPSLAEQKTPLAEAAAVVMGPAGRTLILSGMAISMFGYVSGMTLALPRGLFAFARDGFLPAPLASIHPRFHTPHVAIVLQTIIVIILSASGSFETLAVIANGSILIVYAVCCIAVIQLRRLGVQQTGTPFRIPFAAAIPIVAFLIIARILASLSPGEWKALLMIVALAVVIFAASMPSRRGRAPVVEPSV
jgi:amino acid transporter